jgi:hypothetical protein
MQAVRCTAMTHTVTLQPQQDDSVWWGLLPHSMSNGNLFTFLAGSPHSARACQQTLCSTNNMAHILSVDRMYSPSVVHRRGPLCHLRVAQWYWLAILQKSTVPDDSVVCVLAALHACGGFSGATCLVFQLCNPSLNLLALTDRAQNLVLTHYSIWRHSSIHISFTWSQFHDQRTMPDRKTWKSDLIHFQKLTWKQTYVCSVLHSLVSNVIYVHLLLCSADLSSVFWASLQALNFGTKGLKILHNYVCYIVPSTCDFMWLLETFQSQHPQICMCGPYVHSLHPQN